MSEPPPWWLRLLLAVLAIMAIAARCWWTLTLWYG
jgi:hypothetical protein